MFRLSEFQSTGHDSITIFIHSLISNASEVLKTRSYKKCLCHYKAWLSESHHTCVQYVKVHNYNLYPNSCRDKPVKSNFQRPRTKIVLMKFWRHDLRVQIMVGFSIDRHCHKQSNLTQNQVGNKTTFSFVKHPSIKKSKNPARKYLMIISWVKAICDWRIHRRAWTIKIARNSPLKNSITVFQSIPGRSIQGEFIIVVLVNIQCNFTQTFL